MKTLLHKLACFAGWHHGILWRDSRTGDVVAHECWWCGKRRVFL